MTETAIQAAAHLGANPYVTSLTSGNFSLLADEPLDKGGTNAGPTPQTLLCMSLAACTIITLRMYAERKQWHLGELHCDVQLVTNEDGTRWFDRKISASNPVDEATMQRLLIVADKCPVHKLLTNQHNIQTSWPVS